MPETAQKLQKLASGVYLVTSFFEDKEPLKWKLRSLSIDLISRDIKDKLSVIKDISSIFVVAYNTGLVSKINHDILAQELFHVETELEKPLNTSLFIEKSRFSKLTLPVNISNNNIDIKDKTTQKTIRKPTMKEFGVVSVKKNSRQSIIINMLKRKKELMIKDISPLIKNCSEKTIQRELLSMVSKGILEKIGDKRWSRYRLA